MNKAYIVLVALGVLVLLGLFGTTAYVVSRDAATGTASYRLLPLSADRIISFFNPFDGDAKEATSASAQSALFTTLWFSDFSGDRIGAFDRDGNKVWEQHMGSPPIPSASYATHTEYITVAPNGNLVVADGDGMMVQEIDRQTHGLVWQYGVKDIQGYSLGYLHQPDKSFKLNDHEVLINDGNNRRVIIVDQRTGDIVWQYGETLRMGSGPGLLRGNTSVRPVKEGTQFLITDTLEKKVMLVDRASQQIVKEWHTPNAKWIQHVWYTPAGTLVMEDRQKNEVFELGAEGHVLWTLTTLADGSALKYPTDVIKLTSGHVLIAEAGRNRIIEVNPQTKKLIKSYTGVGFVSTIVIDPEPI